MHATLATDLGRVHSIDRSAKGIVFSRRRRQQVDGLVRSNGSPTHSPRRLSVDLYLFFIISLSRSFLAGSIFYLLSINCSWRDILTIAPRGSTGVPWPARISDSVRPGRSTARISFPSSSRRHARRWPVWLGRRPAASHGDPLRCPAKSSVVRQAHASVIVNVRAHRWNARRSPPPTGPAADPPRRCLSNPGQAEPEERDEPVRPAVPTAGVGQRREAVEERGGHGRLRSSRAVPKPANLPKINPCVALP